MTQEEFNAKIIPVWDMERATENTKLAIVARTTRMVLANPELASAWYATLPKTTLDGARGL